MAVASDLDQRCTRLRELGIDIVESPGVCTVVRRSKGEVVAHAHDPRAVTAREQAVTEAEHRLRLDPIDSALADTFPASDPPSAGQAGI